MKFAKWWRHTPLHRVDRVVWVTSHFITLSSRQSGVMTSHFTTIELRERCEWNWKFAKWWRHTSPLHRVDRAVWVTSHFITLSSRQSGVMTSHFTTDRGVRVSGSASCLVAARRAVFGRRARPAGMPVGRCRSTPAGWSSPWAGSRSTGQPCSHSHQLHWNEKESYQLNEDQDERSSVRILSKSTW